MELSRDSQSDRGYPPFAQVDTGNYRKLAGILHCADRMDRCFRTERGNPIDIPLDTRIFSEKSLVG